MVLQLRDYQQECLQRAKLGNTIVHLPTGKGKTLIAARLIEHYLRERPGQCISVLVPTRALVEQQSAYFERHCRTVGGSPPVVERLIGEDQSGWGQSEWNEVLSSSHILCGTAAIFVQAFISEAFMHIDLFSLFVFDECHNATGNSPMAVVMRDAIAPYYQRFGRESPRILGLTASFDNGNSKNLDKKRRDLEALMQSTIFCPNVSGRIKDDKFFPVTWERNQDIDVHKQVIEEYVDRAVSPLADIKDMARVIRHCCHVFEELGLDALLYYVDKVIVAQVVGKIQSLEAWDQASRGYADRMRRSLPALRHQMSQLHAILESDLMLNKVNSKSTKVERLIDLIKEILSTNGHGFRGIIFVEQVALVSTLGWILNDAFRTSGHGFGAVAGGGYQSEKDRQRQLDQFASGALHCLVSSAALEEGIDVSDCGFVIRYTSIDTTKAHIQGSGRARHEDAVVYYFDNDPTIERLKEARLTGTAKNQSLSLTQQEIDKAASTISQPATSCHPYPRRGGGGGEVNVFNCKKIFNEYCSITLGTSVQPKTHLYRYSSRPGDQKVLASVRYPTPDGWQSKSSDDYRALWLGIDIEEQVFSCAERTKRKSGPEKEEMAFVFLVVVQLRKSGLLDAHNKPNPALKFDTRRACPLDGPWPGDAISIKNAVFQSHFY